MTESIVGIVAGILTGVAMLPQLIKIIKDKNAKDISIGMLLILISGLGMWVWYGILKKDAPIIITNSFSVSVNLAIICLKMVYSKRK